MKNSNRLFIVENLGKVSCYYDCTVSAELLKQPNTVLVLGTFDVSLLDDQQTKQLLLTNHFFYNN